MKNDFLTLVKFEIDDENSDPVELLVFKTMFIMDGKIRDHTRLAQGYISGYLFAQLEHNKLD